MNSMMDQQGIMNVWNNLDTDGMGSVNRGDLYRSLGNYGLSQPQIQGMFNNMDSDYDGQISYQEYLQALGMATDDQSYAWNQFYRQMDTNRTGMISSQDLWNMYDGLNPAPDRSLIEQWISNNVDANGMIDYPSFLNYVQQNAMGGCGGGGGGFGGGGFGGGGFGGDGYY